MVILLILMVPVKFAIIYVLHVYLEALYAHHVHKIIFFIQMDVSHTVR